MITSYTGISGSRIAYLISSRTDKDIKSHYGAAAKSNKMLIVVSTGRDAERLARDISFCASDSAITVIPEEDDIQILYEARNRELQVTRIKGIHALLSDAGDQRQFVIAPVSAAVKRIASPERYLEGVTDI